MTQDLPTHLKITSVSTRLVNLQHQGEKLLTQLGLAPPTPDHTSKKKKSRARRTESSSASELAIKQLLATLQKDFNSYKKAVERRRISSSQSAPAVKSSSQSTPGVKSSSPGKVAIVRGKNDLKSLPPKSQKVTKNEKKTPPVKTSDDGSLLTPIARIRAYTGEDKKVKKRSSAVLKKVEALNKKSTQEDAQALKEIGTSFGPRPRAHTTDSSMSPSKGRSPELPRKTLTAESPMQPDPPVVIRQRSPTSVESVPLRKKGGGVSRAERREKINAIRKIFEATSAESAVTTDKLQERVFEKGQSSTLPNYFSKGQSSVPSTPLEKQPEKSKEEKTSHPVPMETRKRINTLPAVFRTVLKDSAPAKQKVITITMEPEKPATPPLLQLQDAPVS